MSVIITIDNGVDTPEVINMSDAEEKAVDFDVSSIKLWVENAVANKGRQMIDTIIQKAIDGTDPKVILSFVNRKIIESEVVAAGEALKKPIAYGQVRKDSIMAKVILT